MNRFKVFQRGLALAAALVLLSGITNSGRAGIIIPGNEQAHIDYAADPIFQSVGWVSGFDGNQWFTVGSGVLVDEQWVMLTGHQLTSFGFSQYRFSLGPSVFQPNAGRSVADAYYVNGNGGNIFAPDFGLMRLTEPITTATPAIIFDGELAVGTHVVFAGYGRLGYFPSGELEFDGLKRAGENVINTMGPTATVPADRFWWDFGPAYGTSSLPLEMNGSNFHSGGGTFAFVDDRWQLIGIVAGGVPLTDTYAIRPSAYAVWTSEIMSVPEPSTFLLTLVGASGAWFLIRRRSAK